MTTREHGTRARYVHGPGPGTGPGCRCDECTAANRADAQRRERAMLYRRWQPFVDAGPAREHLQALARHGIGRRRAAELAGVSASALSRLLYGGPGSRPPTRRIRPQTAAAILAIRPSADLVAPGVLVGSAGTRHRVQALVAAGWSQAQLAGQLMTSPGRVGALLREERVTAGKAAAVRGLYERLWNQPPPEGNHRARIAASRARNYAAARGWAPPMAWDDEELDKPDGRPANGLAPDRPGRGARRPSWPMTPPSSSARTTPASRLPPGWVSPRAAWSGRSAAPGGAPRKPSTRRSAPASPGPHAGPRVRGGGRLMAVYVDVALIPAEVRNGPIRHNSRWCT